MSEKAIAAIKDIKDGKEPKDGAVKEALQEVQKVVKAATAKKKGDIPPSAAVLQRTLAAIEKGTGLKEFDAPSTTLPHVSTGSTNLDILIGGSQAHDGKPLCPGFPRRRITEVYGAESSGKTTLMLSSLAKLQKTGGCGLFVDFEHHISKKYAIDIGIDWEAPTFGVIQPTNLEEGVKAMFLAIAAGVDLVGVDSVAAMLPKSEMLKKFDDPVKIGSVAAAFSQLLPKFGIWFDQYPKNEKDVKIAGHPGTAVVLLNQVRALINTQGPSRGGDGENTTGGKAIKFYSTLRIRLSRIKSEAVKTKDKLSGREITVPYGNLTHVKIVKSKLDGKQNHTTQIFIRYGYGVDDYYSIIESGITNKFIKKESASRFILDGEAFHGRDKLRKYLIANPKAFDSLVGKTWDIIMQAGKPLDPNTDLGEGDVLLESAARELASLDRDDEENEDGGVSLGGDDPPEEEEIIETGAEA